MRSSSAMTDGDREGEDFQHIWSGHGAWGRRVSGGIGWGYVQAVASVQGTYHFRSSRHNHTRCSTRSTLVRSHRHTRPPLSCRTTNAPRRRGSVVPVLVLVSRLIGTVTDAWGEETQAVTDWPVVSTSLVGSPPRDGDGAGDDGRWPGAGWGNGGWGWHLAGAGGRRELRPGLRGRCANVGGGEYGTIHLAPLRFSPLTPCALSDPTPPALPPTLHLSSPSPALPWLGGGLGSPLTR